MEYMDEASATVAKEALHNYKLDGENKIKVRFTSLLFTTALTHFYPDYVREEIVSSALYSCCLRVVCTYIMNSIFRAFVMLLNTPSSTTLHDSYIFH